MFAHFAALLARALKAELLKLLQEEIAALDALVNAPGLTEKGQADG